MGRFPMDIVIKLRMVMFWNSLIDNSGKLSSILYTLMLKIHESSQADLKWIKYIKSIFDETGLSFIWNDQIHIKKDLLKAIVKQKLFDQFLPTWFSQMNNSTRAELYESFKNEFKLEPYLLRIYMSKFRCSNVKFPIEIGRWTNITQHERICRFCQVHIGSEFHFLFVHKHPQITALRHKYVPRLVRK